MCKWVQAYVFIGVCILVTQCVCWCRYMQVCVDVCTERQVFVRGLWYVCTYPGLGRDLLWGCSYA